MKVLLGLLLAPLLLVAQVNTSSISGVVSDPSSAVVAGATVTLINEDTGVRLTSLTSSAGAYLFPPLQRGRYTISAEAAAAITRAAIAKHVSGVRLRGRSSR